MSGGRPRRALDVGVGCVKMLPMGAHRRAIVFEALGDLVRATEEELERLRARSEETRRRSEVARSAAQALVAESRALRARRGR